MPFDCCSLDVLIAESVAASQLQVCSKACFTLHFCKRWSKIAFNTWKCTCNLALVCAHAHQQAYVAAEVLAQQTFAWATAGIKFFQKAEVVDPDDASNIYVFDLDDSTHCACFNIGERLTCVCPHCASLCLL